MQRLILTLSNQNAYMSPRGCLRRNRNKSPKNNCKKSQLLFVAWPRWAQMCAHCAWLFVKLLFIHIAFFAFNNIHKNIRRQQQRDHGERALKTLKLAHSSYCDFLFSDEDGSDPDEDAESCSTDDEDYNPETEGASPYDKKLGDDRWVGRRICKTFGNHGNFDGIIYAVDDDANKVGYRLFAVYYFDDPDDGEAMWPEEIYQ